jgi:hypothetical protein
LAPQRGFPKQLQFVAKILGNPGCYFFGNIVVGSQVLPTISKRPRRVLLDLENVHGIFWGSNSWSNHLEEANFGLGSCATTFRKGRKEYCLNPSVMAAFQAQVKSSCDCCCYYDGSAIGDVS